jgi:hypothetical protein
MSAEAGKDRASIFDAEEPLDLSGFAPKPAARPEQVRGVAEQAGFRSREPTPAPALPAAPPEPERRAPRRYRTGRNVQLNLKVRQDAVDAFYALADARGWVLGEAFEHAVAALEREIGKPSG